MEMVKLPAGVKIHKNGQKYVGEIPANLCPARFKKKDKIPKVDEGAGK